MFWWRCDPPASRVPAARGRRILGGEPPRQRPRAGMLRAGQAFVSRKFLSFGDALPYRGMPLALSDILASRVTHPDPSVLSQVAAIVDHRRPGDAPRLLRRQKHRVAGRLLGIQPPTLGHQRVNPFVQNLLHGLPRVRASSRSRFRTRGVSRQPTHPHSRGAVLRRLQRRPDHPLNRPRPTRAGRAPRDAAGLPDTHAGRHLAVYPHHGRPSPEIRAGGRRCGAEHVRSSPVCQRGARPDGTTETCPCPRQTCHPSARPPSWRPGRRSAASPN